MMIGAILYCSRIKKSINIIETNLCKKFICCSFIQDLQSLFKIILLNSFRRVFYTVLIHFSICVFQIEVAYTTIIVKFKYLHLCVDAFFRLCRQMQYRNKISAILCTSATMLSNIMNLQFDIAAHTENRINSCTNFSVTIQ